MKLKYGMNPNQSLAELADNSHLRLLNGNPSMINYLDGLNSWQLVREMDQSSGLPSAASFKHVTPSGVAIGLPLSKAELMASHFEKQIGTPLTWAYLRARGTDRLASFGDFIALSRVVDEPTARIIRGEVSDGIIAPGYAPGALEILKGKKKGGYVILEIDADYQPQEMESRTVFGFNLTQQRNNLEIDSSLLETRVTRRKNLPEAAQRNLLIGMITLKYTQSNSICVVYNGQAIGIGSGQQSRILCTELALGKANRWHQKNLLDFSRFNYPQEATRTEKDQLVEQARKKQYGEFPMSADLEGLCLCSDGFFPQVDNIKLAHDYGIEYIASPMGSIRDEEIIETCDRFGMTFINTGIRLFHH